MSESITRAARRPSRGRAVGLVPFAFGVAGRQSLPGVGLRRILEDLGLSPDAARALLSRMCRQGQLARTSRGREVDYRLADSFAEAFKRIRDQAMASAQHWPGHFQAVLYLVPEEHRAFRDALRRSAVLAGYGLLQPGVLICTVDRRREFAELVRGKPPPARVWSTTLGMTRPDAAEAASIAWDLPDLAAVYRSHVEVLTAYRDQEDGRHAFRSFADVLLPALIDTNRQPTLPAELLPACWPGTDLRRAIGEFSAAHRPMVQSYVAGVLDPSAGEPGRLARDRRVSAPR